MPLAGPGISQAKIGQDLNNPDIIDSKDPAERLVQLKRILMEAIETRDSIMSELKKFPFMDATQRQRYRKALPAYDAKIKRLKLDIMAAETICKMGKEYLDNPQIKTNFQNYATG
jgi:hypothetical protein